MNTNEARLVCENIDIEMSELRKRSLHKYDDIADQALDIKEFARDYLTEIDNPQNEDAVEDLLIRIEGLRVQADNLQKAYVNAREKTKFERGR